MTVTDAALAGLAAVDALAEVLRGVAAPDERRFAEPPLRRVVRALASGGASVLDRAVLVRHALRYASAAHNEGRPLSLVVPDALDWPDAARWRQVGVIARREEHGMRVQALPWRPAWLDDVPDDGVDGEVTGATPRRTLDPVAGDPFLRRFGGRTTYQSPGQRAAVRAALTMPPGATLLICLPTGEGKSYVFQLVAALGFGDDGEGDGVTVVVTPTVALALDQERAAQELGHLGEPRAYIGGEQHAPANRALADAIRRGTQRLCFASPEALCGALRAPLLEAARAGYLRALALDEAHLVESWGANFRPEFQQLAGLRRELLAAARDAGRPQPRTLLLSATFTPGAVETLRLLFATDADGRPSRLTVVAAARLRPEIAYWVAPEGTGSEQRERVMEALLHLPRPAVLYVTEPWVARRWLADLRRVGFLRVASLTGETDQDERQRVVDAWRADNIDLVIGTSAFGLGIDKSDVRAIVHACVPESLDRLYQEAGRGGRDGNASLALLVPTERDRGIARSMSQRRMITTEKGLRRWRAMFTATARRTLGADHFVVPLDEPPGRDETYIDMRSEQSTDWNVRTLNLMAAGGLLALLAPGTETEEGAADGARRPTQSVRLLDLRHLDEGVWQECVEPVRERIATVDAAAWAAMERYLRRDTCVADVLAPLYTVHAPDAPDGPPLIRVGRACGGCPACRAAGRRREPEPLPSPPHPWPPQPVRREPLAGILRAYGRLVVFYEPEEITSQLRARTFRDRLARLLREKVHNLYLLGDTSAAMDPVALQENSYLAGWPLFLATKLVPPLPAGPALVFLQPGERLPWNLRQPRDPCESRVYLVPAGATDPDRPGALLRDHLPPPAMSLEDLVRVLQS
jgi:superfamily II DNA helicase RecQ